MKLKHISSNGRGIDLLIRNRKYEFNLIFKLLFNLDCIGFNDKDSSKGIPR